MNIHNGQIEFQLSYGDCDTVGIAYFGIYYRWMERCYSNWLYSHGLRSGELLDQLGVITVGVSSGADYVDTAKVFDLIQCQAVRDKIGASSYRVGFEFTRNEALVTRGQITFVCREPDFSKSTIHDRLRDVLMTLPEPHFAVRS